MLELYLDYINDPEIGDIKFLALDYFSNQRDNTFFEILRDLVLSLNGKSLIEGNVFSKQELYNKLYSYPAVNKYDRLGNNHRSSFCYSIFLIFYKNIKLLLTFINVNDILYLEVRK